MNKVEERVLVQVLADVDTVFEPIRTWKPQARVTNKCEAREGYDSQGIKWRHPGDSAEDRKAIQRALTHLSETGLLEVVKTGQRTRYLKLTLDGEQHARALVGLCGIGGAIVTLRRVQKLQNRFHQLNPDETGSGGVWETWLGNFEHCDPGANAEMYAVASTALPALVHRWLSAASTLHGHVSYTVTDRGHDVLQEPPEFIERPAIDTKTWTKWAKLYKAQRASERQALAKRKPQTVGELGAIPIPLPLSGYSKLEWVQSD